MRFLLDVVRTGITLLSGLLATIVCATAAIVVTLGLAASADARALATAGLALAAGLVLYLPWRRR